ncbi:MAG: hypothetical protein WC357_06695, partial [Candidatus Omnitrophota bacterium]
SGNKTDIKDADISRLYDAAGRIRYRVIDSIRYKGQEAIRYKEEYKNGRGLLEERHFGRIDKKSGEFVNEMTVYSFYLNEREKVESIGKGNSIGKYEVADITVTTVYDEDGKNETIYSLSNNNTGIAANGDVFYCSKFGKASLVPLDINYANIKATLRQLDQNILFEYVQSVRQEVKDNKGRLVVIKDGFLETDSKGFGKGIPKYINFLLYGNVAKEVGLINKVEQVNRELSAGSYIFRYKPGSENLYQYSAKDPKEGYLAINNNFNLEYDLHKGAYYMKYDIEDRREGKTLANKSYRLDGRLAKVEFLGNPGEPEKINLYYYHREYPEYSLGTNKNYSNSEIWRNYHRYVVKDVKDGVRHTYVIDEEIDPVRETYHKYGISKLIYPELGWNVVRDGVFLARTSKWDYSTEEYKGSRNIGDDVANSAPYRIVGGKRDRIEEAIEARKLYSSKHEILANSNDVSWDLEKARDNRSDRWENSNLSVALVASILVSGVVFLWWLLKFFTNKININSSDKEKLEQIFSPRDAGNIISYRTERGVIEGEAELAAILVDTKTSKVRSKINFTGKSGISAEQIAVLSTVKANALSATVLSSINQYVQDLIAKGFISAEEAEAIIRGFVVKLHPYIMPVEMVQAKVLSKIFLAAYWDVNLLFKDKAREELSRAIKELCASINFAISDNYLKEIIQEISTLRPTELAYQWDKSTYEGNVSLDTHLWVFDPKMDYQVVSLEDFILKYKVMYTAIPFFATHTPVIRWFAIKIKQLVKAGRANEVRIFLAEHRKYWYQVLKDQLDNNWEQMRDDRRKGPAYKNEKTREWNYIITWEELNDLFRYLLVEDDYGIALSFKTDTKFVEFRKNVENHLNKEVYDLSGLNNATSPVVSDKISPKDIQSKVDTIYKPFILYSRENLGLPRYDRHTHNEDQKSSGKIAKIVDTMKPHIPFVKRWRSPERGESGIWGFITFKLLLNRKFWTNDSPDKEGALAHLFSRIPVVVRIFMYTGLGIAAIILIPEISIFGFALPWWAKVMLPFIALSMTKLILDNGTLKEKRAKLFWGAVSIAVAAFILYIISFVSVNWIFMPIPFEINLFSLHLMLPWWSKIVLVLLSISPFADMFFLTYFAFSNLAKAAVRWYLEHKYCFYKAKTFKKAMELLPVLLKNRDWQDKFKMLIDELYGNYDLSTEEYNTFKAALEAIKNNQNFRLPVSLTIPSVEQEIKNFVNKAYRKDMPSDPRSLLELRSITKQISGFGEGPFAEFDKINSLPTSASIQTQLGMIATSYPGKWKVFVARLKEKRMIDDPQENELLNLIKHSNYVLRLFKVDEKNSEDKNREIRAAKLEIEEWFNTHVQSGYANIRSALKLRKVYEYYIKKFLPNLSQDEIQDLVNDYIQFAFVYDMKAQNLQAQLRDATGNKSLNIEDYPRILREEAKNNLNGQIIVPEKYLDKDGKEQKIAWVDRKLLELLAKENVYISKGGIFKTGNIMEKTDIHDAKYTSWMSFMNTVRGEFHMALDWDHIHPFAELWFIPNAIKRFFVDGALAGGPYNSDIITRPISSVANTMGLMEEGWLDGEQPVKDEVDAILFYGKGFKRVAALRNCEMLSGDDSVQEDAFGLMKALSKGYHTSAFHFYKTYKGLSNVVTAALVPLKKWSGDSSEAVRLPAGIKFFLSPNISWTKKLGNLISWGFYMKKPSVMRVTTWVLVLYYIGNLNPWFGLAFSLWFMSLLLSQAIAYGGLFKYIGQFGRIKGVLLFIRDLIVHFFIFATGIITSYADSVSRGDSGFCKFIRTAGKGESLFRTKMMDLYVYGHKGITVAAILMLFVIFASFDPVKFIIWLPQIATVGIGWLTFIFMLEPLSSDKPLRDILVNIKNTIVGFILGIFDGFVNFITNPTRLALIATIITFSTESSLLTTLAISITTFILAYILRAIRVKLSESIYKIAKEALIFASKNGVKHDNVATLDTFIGQDKTPPSGFHYALRGYFEGRIKGLPSLVLVLYISKLSKQLDSKNNEVKKKQAAEDRAKDHSSSPITDSDLRAQAEETISAWKDAFTGRSAEFEYLFNIYLRY